MPLVHPRLERDIKIAIIGDSRVSNWNDTFSDIMSKQSYEGISVDVYSYPGKTAAGTAREFALRNNNKYYDIAYFLAGVNDVSDKFVNINDLRDRENRLKSSQVQLKFNNDDLFVVEVAAALMTSKKILKGFATKIVICEFLGIKEITYNEANIKPEKILYVSSPGRQWVVNKGTSRLRNIIRWLNRKEDVHTPPLLDLLVKFQNHRGSYRYEKVF